jgi:hypothetical protein
MHCIKNKEKTCPAKTALKVSSSIGILNQDSESLLKCCKVQSQIEAAKRLGIPGGMIMHEIKQRGKI